MRRSPGSGVPSGLLPGRGGAISVGTQIRSVAASTSDARGNHHGPQGCHREDAPGVGRRRRRRGEPIDPGGGCGDQESNGKPRAGPRTLKRLIRAVRHSLQPGAHSPAPPVPDVGDDDCPRLGGDGAVVGRDGDTPRPAHGNPAPAAAPAPAVTVPRKGWRAPPLSMMPRSTRYSVPPSRRPRAGPMARSRANSRESSGAPEKAMWMSLAARATSPASAVFPTTSARPYPPGAARNRRARRRKRRR
jgi:hypothetical protein